MLGFTIIRRAITEFIGWRRLYKATAEDNIDQQLRAAGFKISWLGVPYKLMPIPNEFMETQATLTNYIFSQLREINDTVTVPLRISDLIYPSFVDVAPGMYLIKLSPQTEYLQVKKILPVLSIWGIVGWIGTKLFIKFDAWSHLVDAWNSIMAFLG